MKDPAAIAAAVDAALADPRIVDIHTHLYPPSFGTPLAGASGRTDPKGLMLWGIDELITYHYLIAELFRVVEPSITPADFYALNLRDRADLIWTKLFIERSPVSEACRGVLTTLHALGLDTESRDLGAYRDWFAQQDPDAHIDRIMSLAGVESITMTNDPFDANERARWLADPKIGDDPRFTAVLRLDPLILDWPIAAKALGEMGYDVGEPTDAATLETVRRFLADWIDRMGAIYLAASLPPDFAYPSDDPGVTVLEKAILPVCAERKLPFAMMIGVERATNPALGQAGDMGFAADVHAVTRLCAAFPENKFMLTMLSLENQHELAVAARKFGNLMVFGCWWFLNNPSIIETMTRFRMELLGTSFIPQHSDCRVLEQLLYKWSHSKVILARVLTDKYVDLAATGWAVSEAEIRRDVDHLLRSNFHEFLKR